MGKPLSTSWLQKSILLTNAYLCITQLSALLPHGSLQLLAPGAQPRGQRVRRASSAHSTDISAEQGQPSWRSAAMLGQLYDEPGKCVILNSVT